MWLLVPVRLCPYGHSGLTEQALEAVGCDASGVCRPLPAALSYSQTGAVAGHRPALFIFSPVRLSPGAQVLPVIANLLVTVLLTENSIHFARGCSAEMRFPARYSQSVE